MSTKSWSTSLNSYLKALESLDNAVSLGGKREISELEKQGFIQTFEYTHELAIALFKAYMNKPSRSGNAEEITREAEYMGLIGKESGWMKMLRSRREALHSYDSDTAEKVSKDIRLLYHPLLTNLAEKMQGLRTGQDTGLF